MKSIKTKLCSFLAVVCLALFSFTTAKAQDVPTDAEVQELLANPDARTLISYFEQQGYKNTGVIPESKVALTTTSGTAAGNVWGSSQDGGRIVGIAVRLELAGKEPIDVSISSERSATGLLRDAVAENTTTEFAVVGGVVKSVLKSVANFIQKLNFCWNRFVQGGGVINCTNCYNCLRNALSSGSWWSKLIRVLRCAPPCFRCIRSLYQFYLCMRH